MQMAAMTKARAAAANATQSEVNRSGKILFRVGSMVARSFAEAERQRDLCKRHYGTTTTILRAENGRPVPHAMAEILRAKEREREHNA